jgi:signal transduction histidine kinase
MKKKSVQLKNPCTSVIQTNYDIVKAHVGELKVESNTGVGTEFIVLLPIV